MLPPRSAASGLAAPTSARVRGAGLCALVGLLALVSVGSSGLMGCGSDATPRCEEAYEHLAALASHEPHADEQRRFVSACIDAFDERRHRCLMAATSAEEALRCRPARVRPA